MLYYHVEANGLHIVCSFDCRAGCYKKYRAGLDEAIDFGCWIWVECMLIRRFALLLLLPR